jgi:hypothetical protein
MIIIMSFAEVYFIQSIDLDDKYISSTTIEKIIDDIPYNLKILKPHTSAYLHIENFVNLDEIFKTADMTKFKQMDYGKNDERLYDIEHRDSFISDEIFNLDITCHISHKLNMSIDKHFEFIKYEVGGHFKNHKDRKRYDNHTHTICIYPPCPYDGGELILDDQYYFGVSKEYWTCIIFPINMRHQSMEVTSGTKYVFKGTCSFTDLTDHKHSDECTTIQPTYKYCTKHKTLLTETCEDEDDWGGCNVKIKKAKKICKYKICYSDESSSSEESVD